MSVRPIVLLGDPRLRLKGKPVDSFGKYLHGLLDDLAHTMRDAPGVGLAAPQLGEAMQACVIEVENQLYELVNPRIVRSTGAGAMRPSTALLSDGPQNLLDAVTVAREVGARGVVAVLSGAVHSAMDVRKAHSYRVDAFTSGEAGMLGVVEEGRVRCFRGWPATVAAGLRTLPAQPDAWPVVEIITSHAGAGGRLMQAALAAGVHGIVVAGSGNGGVNVALEVELRCAQEAGVLVWRSSRCLQGPVQAKPGDVFPDAGNLTPVKARIEMMLQLLETRRDASS